MPGEDDVIGIHAGPGTSPLPADWYLAAFPLLTVLTEILRFAQDDGGRREGIEAAPVVGWPLDSCHSERSKESRCAANMKQ